MFTSHSYILIYKNIHTHTHTQQFNDILVKTRGTDRNTHLCQTQVIPHSDHKEKK